LDDYVDEYIDTFSLLRDESANLVVLKRVRLGSPREEFLIPRRKFVPGRNWGGKAVDKKTSCLYYLFIQHIKTDHRYWFSLDGIIYSRGREP